MTSIIRTVAGICGVAGYKSNGLAIEGLLSSPMYIAVDKFTNLYIADAGNFVVRKVAGDSGVFSTIAGTPGVAGSGDCECDSMDECDCK